MFGTARWLCGPDRPAVAPEAVPARSRAGCPGPRHGAGATGRQTLPATRSRGTARTTGSANPWVPSGEDLQQPLRQDCGRVGVLPGDQVAVLHHVWLPDRAAAELDADLFLQLVLEQPLAPGGHSDGLLLLIGEA